MILKNFLKVATSLSILLLSGCASMGKSPMSIEGAVGTANHTVNNVAVPAYVFFSLLGIIVVLLLIIVGYFFYLKQSPFLR